MRTMPSLLFVLILFGRIDVAAAQDETLTLDEIVTLKTVASAALSPSGEHIAYLLNAPRVPYVDEDGGAYRELHITDLEGNSRGFITRRGQCRADRLVHRRRDGLLPGRAER